MVEDAEKGYEVVDKRVKHDEQAEEPVATEPEAAPEQTESEQESPQEEIPAVNIYGLMQWFVAMLAESSWQFMGLQINPSTKKLEKDMIQAKVAVDTIVFLTDQLAPHVSEEQRRAYRMLVSDLRVNFVQQSNKE